MSQLSNTVAQTQLSFEQRKSLAVAFWFKEWDGYRTNPLDLTGTTLRFVVAQPPQLGGATVIEKDIELINELEGTAQLNLQASDLDVAAAEYLYTCTLVTTEGYSAVFMKGELEVLENQDLLAVDDEYSGVAPPQSLSVLLGKSNRVIIGIEHLPNPSLQVGEVTLVDGPPTVSIDGSYPNQQINFGFPVTPIDYDVTDGQLALFVADDASDTAGAVDDRIDAKLDAKTWLIEDITNFPEGVDDRVAALLTEGANIDLTYDDAAGTLTIASTGGGGGGDLPWFHPKDYGAVGNGIADDTAALQAAADAARAAKGTVYIGGKSNTVYAISDVVEIYGDAGLFGDLVKSQLGTGGSTIKFIDDAAQIKMAGLTSPYGESSRGGAFHDFNIDANGYDNGDCALLFDLGLGRSVYNVNVIKSGGDGMRLNCTQNSTFTHVDISLCEGTGIVLDNGAGGNLFLRGEIDDNGIGIETRDSEPGTHGGYAQGPARNTFLHSLFEDYRLDGVAEVLGKFEYGSTRFISCGFTANTQPMSSGYLVEVTKNNSGGTQVAFSGGCTFNGHNDTNGVFVGDQAAVYLEGNIACIYMDYLFVTDGASIGYVTGSVNLIGGAELFLQLPGGTFLGWRFNDYFGRDQVSDAGVSSALPYRMFRKGEAYPRYALDNSGKIFFGDGVTAPGYLYYLGHDATYGANLHVGGLMVSGRRGHVRTVNGAASGAVTLNTKTASHAAVLTAASITSMAFSNPVDGAEFTVQIAKGSLSHSIAWPTDVQFANGRPPTVSQNYTYVTFRYDGVAAKWQELNRSEEVGTSTRLGPKAVYSAGSLSAWPNLSSILADNQMIWITLTGNVTITPALLPTPGTFSVHRLIVRFTQDATGSRTLTLDAAIKSAGGVDPVLSVAANAIDLVEFIYDGTQWIARMLAQAIA